MEWLVQWAQSVSRWECLACGGISLSRDFDTMTHQTNDAEVERLRERYSSTHGEAKDRFTKPNILFHRQGCKFMSQEAT